MKANAGLLRGTARSWPLLFAANLVAWTTFHALPALLGLFVGRAFDALSKGDTSAAWTAVAAVLAVGVARIVAFGAGIYVFSDWWHRQVVQLRRNLLRWLLTAPGSRRLPYGPGAAVSTFRDDVDEVTHHLENWIDFGGLAVYVVLALGIMGRIDWVMTVAAVVPSVIALYATRRLAPVVTRRREEARARTEQVTAFLGDHFSAITAVKAAHAEEPMLAHFDRINERRAEAGVADTATTELVTSLNRNMANLAAGIVLLLGASALHDGRITVGDLTVFLVTIPVLAHYLSWGGDMISRASQAAVSVQRLEELAVDGDRDAVFATDPLDLDLPAQEFPPLRLRDDRRLQAFEVRGLSVTHPDGSTGVTDVSFTVPRGSFTVVTGRIGSGKSTLLRALLGLVPRDGGQILWNGEVVRDPARFLTPPRSAYTPQAPKLVSDTLAGNISLGRAVEPERLRHALDLAVMTPDLVRMESGIDTMVGSRGVRLSGGQVQRSAAARMFATDAELLVFDDLSSALDVRTEARLWDGLFAARDVTCLVVSHRRPALRRADQILLMDGGRLVDSGTLGDLLSRNALMRALWDSDVSAGWERAADDSAGRAPS